MSGEGIIKKRNSELWTEEAAEETERRRKCVTAAVYIRIHVWASYCIVLVIVGGRHQLQQQQPPVQVLLVRSISRYRIVADDNVITEV